MRPKCPTSTGRKGADWPANLEPQPGRRRHPETGHAPGLVRRRLPCHADGTPISAIANSSGDYNLGHGLTAKHHFSSKPDGGYNDYYEKMTTYAGVLAGQADCAETRRDFTHISAPEEEDDGPFNYTETASDRVGIGASSEKFTNDVISIIGLGGTGSYTLDFVSKTPVREIRLFDADEFLQHNAFRAPGEASLEELREVLLKVEYFKQNTRKCIAGSSPTRPTCRLTTCTCLTEPPSPS